MIQPLTGLRVIDLTQVLAGPYATYQLALLGAEVIKVEHPEAGDWTRAGQSLPGHEGQNMGAVFLTQNSNKKSLTLDLKKSAGLVLLKKLITTADIFVENFKPGTAARLGLAFDDVKAVNNKILYCSISAYGQDGPISHRPAYDHVVQGMCGIMRSTGTPETEPNKVGSPYIDYATGLNAAFAIVSGLHEIRRTDAALHLDVAMLDTSMLLMASLMTQCLSLGIEPLASGNQAFSRSPSSGAFATSNGTLMIAANNERQFRDLCLALELAEVLQDPRWSDLAERKQHVEELHDVIAGRIQQKSADEWEQLLDAVSVPAARVRSMAEVLAEQQLKTRGITAAMDIPGSDSKAHVPTVGFKANAELITPTSPPPSLGADTEALLRAINIDTEELAQLRAEGVI